MRKIAAAGCTNNNMFGGYHTWEGRYAHGSTDGFMNSEYSLHTGFEFELSDKTTLSFGSNHAAESDCEMTVEHKVDANWTVSATQSFDASKVVDKEKGARLNLPQRGAIYPNEALPYRFRRHIQTLNKRKEHCRELRVCNNFALSFI